jgi:Xaa-Pro aminopeptidase
MAGFQPERLARFRAVMAEKGWDAAVVRNNADLRWLTGAERVFDFETAHSAFITQDGLWLHTDSRYIEAFLERLGSDSPWQFDEEPVSHPAWVAAHIASTRSRVVALEDTLDLGFYDELAHEVVKCGAGVTFGRCHDVLTRLRMVKDEEELALLREAQKITDAAFTYICGEIHPGMTELELRAMLENYMLAHGADGLSFESIIASGPNGANPHAQPSERVIQEGDLIVMDYGALYHDYHADMTRTVCVGTPSEEQLAAYEAVRRANETSEAMLKAGVTGAVVHQNAVDVLTEAGYGPYFRHGLGHGVGVEIHELPNLNLRWTEELPAGSVVTIEPGVYLPGKFGIRLEDMGVLTQEGIEIFTQSPHELVCVGTVN